MKNTEYSKRVKKRLIDMDKNQIWLIESVRERTGLFLDSAYLTRILQGKRNPKKIIRAINDILEVEK